MSVSLPTAEITVAAGDPDDRIDRYAAARFGLQSRAKARKLVSRGFIRLNGEQVETSRRVRPGDTLTLAAPPEKPPPVFPMSMEVAWLDEHIAVVVKPPGLPVSGNKHRTVEHALPHNLPPSEHPGALTVPRPVHRLDARTAGLLVVARTGAGQVGMGQLFERREVHKRYRAILVGRLEGEGEVDSPIEGRAALSRYRAVEHTRSLRGGWLTTVDLWPVTGRTHQLRIHCKELGCPVLGDDLYGGEHVLRGKGLYLRSVALRFNHPVTGEPIAVELPEAEKYASLRRRERARWERLRASEAQESSPTQ